jgi:hypothetical protein
MFFGDIGQKISFLLSLFGIRIMLASLSAFGRLPSLSTFEILYSSSSLRLGHLVINSSWSDCKSLAKSSNVSQSM